MNIISWNIRRNSHTNINDSKKQIAEALRPYRQEPFICFILETKGDYPNDVAGALKSEIECSATAVDVGGSAYRRESILVLYRGLNELTASTYDDWKMTWDSAIQNQQEININRSQQRRESAVNSLNLRQRTHSPTRDANEGFGNMSFMHDHMNHVTELEYPVSNDIRSPAVVTFAHYGDRWRIGAVHAPGPRDGVKLNMHYAKMYFDIVLAALDRQVDVIVGDFNLYEEHNTCSGFNDVSMHLGTTTYNESGHVSRLDRVYVRAGVYGTPPVKFGGNCVGGKDCVTDHYGIAYLGVGKRSSRGCSPMTTSPNASVVCSECRAIHGSWSSVINQWHRCQACGMVFCGKCASSFKRPDGNNWTMARECKNCNKATALIR